MILFRFMVFVEYNTVLDCIAYSNFYITPRKKKQEVNNFYRSYQYSIFINISLQNTITWITCDISKHTFLLVMVHLHYNIRHTLIVHRSHLTCLRKHNNISLVQ